MSWIHVGTDYAKDYEAAERYRCDPFHLIREGDEQKPVEGARTISSLFEFTQIVNFLVEQNYPVART